MRKLITISIRPEQYNWMKSHRLVISGMVQDWIDAYIEKYEGKI